MSDVEQRRRCAWCGAWFSFKKRPGRPPLYCRSSHRQRQHEARREAARVGIAPGQVVLSRKAYDELRDSLYRLEASAEDTAIDAADADSVAALRRLVASLASEITSTTQNLPEPTAES